MRPPYLRIDQITDEDVRRFRRKILGFYRKHGRDLPFRRTTDSYHIAVAEIMLQQTQVERVVDKYEAWIARWPSWRDLARAATKDLLTAWSGLGYNRRALYLGRMAQAVVTDFGGVLPEDPAILKTLPGIGEYTANAIAIFAFNRPLVTIDTNIRKVFLLEFHLPETTTRAELVALAERVLPRRRSRDWHNALMDYSRLALRTTERRITPVSRQSRFEGSRRQIRGEIVRRLTRQQSVRLAQVAEEMQRSLDDVREAAMALEKEGLVEVTPRTARLRR